MSNKDDAEVMRKVASHMEEMSNLLGQLSEEDWVSLQEEVLTTAQAMREEADKLDPTVEWKEGDYALDGEDDLWYFDGFDWISAAADNICHAEDELHLLESQYGKLRRAYVADTTKQEVVVSLDGIDRALLDEGLLSSIRRVGRRAAEAAREQLGEVQ